MSTYSFKSSIGRRLKVKIVDDLPVNSYSRTVSAGKTTMTQLRPSAYRLRDLSELELEVIKVDSYQQYIGGCSHGAGCFGHISVTPNGNLLPPHKYASILGVQRNQYAKAAEALFMRDTRSGGRQFAETINSLMLTKFGKMRGKMPAGVVDGSAREVIATCPELEPMMRRDKVQYFCVPENVAKNMRVLRSDKDPKTGEKLGVYTEDRLRERDWILSERPPTLWAGNTQPCQVVIWHHSCFGLAPTMAAAFHADHDGDEMQIFFIGSEEAIKECEKWVSLNDSNPFYDALKNADLPASAAQGVEDLVTVFMVYSTISIRELLEGEKMPNISKVARVKPDMTDMLSSMMKNPDAVKHNYFAECSRGIVDVMNQQLNQGRIGHMSRQAKLAASLIRYEGNGVYKIGTNGAPITVVDPELQSVYGDIKYPLGGNPTMRAVMTGTQKAQQAFLDSHRARKSNVAEIVDDTKVVKHKKAVFPSLDVIENLFTGGEITLVVISGACRCRTEWKFVDKSTGITYAIVNINSSRSGIGNIVGTYHPSILRMAAEQGSDIHQICITGLTVVCNYYEMHMTALEIRSLAILLTYQADRSPFPITVKEGLMSRDANWMVSIFASHYGEIKNMIANNAVYDYVRPTNIVDAVALGNLSYLKQYEIE